MLRPLDETKSHLAELFAGRFTIHRKLEWNGMALVYHAATLSEAVALAVLPLDCEATGNNDDVFGQTMKRVSAVPHPVFMPIKEAGVQLGVPFVAYDWEERERECLEAMLRGGPLSWGLASRVARRVLQGLVAAHENGVFHGDLTPSNILYSPDDDDVRVLGLGFAPMLRFVRPDTTGPTGRGSGPGAVRYLAPEILAGGRGSRAADIFAVGALIHRMMSGQPPGKGSVDEGEVPGLTHFLRVAMDAEPAQRFADAATMLEALLALDTATKREPSVAIPLWDDAAPRKKRDPAPEKKSRTGLWFGVLLVAAVAGAIVVGLQHSGADGDAPADNAEVEPESPEPVEEVDDAAEESREESAREDAADESEEEVAVDEELAEELAVDEGEVLEDDILPPAPEAPTAGGPLNRAPLPDFLAATMAKVESGFVFEHPDYREIYGWIRNHRDDVRGHLVLCRAFMSRGWYTAAFERYGHVYDDFPEEAISDPQSLRDLIEIIARGDEMTAIVFPLMRRHYGRDALPEVEAALSATESRRERRMLESLSRRIRRL